MSRLHLFFNTLNYQYYFTRLNLLELFVSFLLMNLQIVNPIHLCLNYKEKVFHHRFDNRQYSKKPRFKMITTEL